MSLVVEVRKSALRPRTWVTLLVATALPSMLAIAIAASNERPRDPGEPAFFLAGTLRNGAAVPFATLLAVSGFLLPLLVAVHAADAIGGEASGGTLRYLLVRPVPRARLYMAKLVATSALAAVATFVVVGAGLLWGALLFDDFAPLGIRGTRFPLPVKLGTAAYVGRLAVAAGYVVLIMTAVGAIALVLGMITGSPGAANGIVVGLLIAMQILGAISSLRRIRPVLLATWFAEWSHVLEVPVGWTAMAKGALCAVAYIVVFTAAGITIFRRRDILS
jgi:ABC-2 type transport system permease protein